MQKRLISLFLVLTALSSCSSNFSYKCYLGNMIPSTFSLPYNFINSQVIVDNAGICQETMYANAYILKTQEELNVFYNGIGATISDSEQKKYGILPSGKHLLYAIFQVPKGYLAYKRDNIQSPTADAEDELVSENFYYYASKLNQYYLFLDLKEDRNITSSGTYSFFFYYSKSYGDLTVEQIRFLYSTPLEG